MFFNFDPFLASRSSSQQQQQNQQNLQNQQNNQPNQYGGGFNQFLNSTFMNPFLNSFQRQQQSNQHRQQPNQNQSSQPRPTYTRSGHRKNKKQSKKKQPIFNENTGIFWKQKGNIAFKEGNYQKAYQHYSKAIELNNSESIFFSNRARSLKKLGKLDQALKDAQQAVELDVENIKAHLIAGQVLAEIGKIKKDQKKVITAITRLTKALTLCGGQKKQQFQQQLSIFIYRAKKLLWYLKFNQIREMRIEAINNYKNYLEKDPKLKKEEIQKKIQAFLNATNETICFQIPDYLCCRITLDLMQQPVITQSGQTYERSAIEEHIQRNGKTDPFTRKPISSKLYPSISVKKAVENFLENNPWAYEFNEGQNYNDILF